MADQQSVDQLQQIVTECIDTPIDKLVSKPEWGEINFDAARPDIEQVLRILTPFRELPIEGLPQNVVAAITNGATPVRDTLKQIKDFSLGIENPSGQRDGLTNQLHAQTEQLYQQATPWIPYLEYERGDIQTKIAELNATVSEAKRILEATKVETETQKEAIKSIISAAREAAASVGVAHFTEDFRAEAKNLEGSATRWLIATMVAAGLTAAAALIFIFAFPLPDKADPAHIVQYTTSKLVLLGLLFTASVWCGHMYRATKHQVSLNKHRANGLKTFQAFVKAASDDLTRDAVLLETTRSIFAPRSSGYIKESDRGTEGGLKLVEFVKSGAERSGSQES